MKGRKKKKNDDDDSNRSSNINFNCVQQVQKAAFVDQL